MAWLCSTVFALPPCPQCPLDTVGGRIYYRYTVEKSIGLYRIGVNFGVSQEDILRANPELQHRGLRYGDMLLIPAREEDIAQPVAQEISLPLQDTVIPLQDTVIPLQDTVFPLAENPLKSEETVIDTIWETAMDKLPVDSFFIGEEVIGDNDTTIRIAVMLPFQTEVLKRDKATDRFYDFYAGVLLAVYEEQEKGQAIAVYTYDVGKTESKVEEALLRPEMARMDAIIGPAYSAQVARVANFLRQDSISRQDSVFMVVPFISRVEGIEENPFVLQFNPSEQAEAERLAQYLSEKSDSVRCVLVEPREDETLPAGIAALHRALKTYRVPTSTVSIRALLTDSIEGVFDTERENIVVFNTERWSHLQTLMPHLLAAQRQYPVTLLSHYAWQKEQVMLPQIYTSVFRVQPQVSEDYEENYRLYFGHTLSSWLPRFDLLGYDLTRQTLQLLSQQKARIGTQEELLQHTYWGLQSNIRYERVGEQGGWENRNIQVIRR